jgi:hypothetical protein
MSHDRQLVETIKQHFACKSLAQLQAIVEANDQSRWSAEAVIAATEVLRDRKAGRAAEPAVPDEEKPDPPLRSDAYALAYLGRALFGGMSGYFILPLPGPDDASVPPDSPVPFGSNLAWLAIDSTDSEAVAAALDLQDAQPSTWADGIKAARASAVFITPPLGQWTLVASTALFPRDRADSFVKPLLERLSQLFTEAQYFGTHGSVGLHIWARARRGRLVRGYGWLGDKSLTLWDEGVPTKDEVSLRLVFLEGRSRDGALPDEAVVLQIANLWSIDPSSLDDEFMEPETGIVGNWAQRES